MVAQQQEHQKSRDDVSRLATKPQRPATSMAPLRGCKEARARHGLDIDGERGARRAYCSRPDRCNTINVVVVVKFTMQGNQMHAVAANTWDEVMDKAACPRWTTAVAHHETTRTSAHKLKPRGNQQFTENVKRLLWCRAIKTLRNRAKSVQTEERPVACMRSRIYWCNTGVLRAAQVGAHVGHGLQPVQRLNIRVHLNLC